MRNLWRRRSGIRQRSSGVLRWYEKLLLVICAMLIAVLLAVVNLAGGASNPDRIAPREDLQPKAGHGDRVEDAPDFLCRTEGQQYLRSKGAGSNAGVALDRAGRFALYGAADSRGRPTRDSFEILRGCDAGLSFTNYTTLQVGDAPPGPAGLSNLLSPTAVTGDASQAMTRYEFPQGVTMTQRAALEQDGLLLSYEVTNTSRTDRTLSFRSLLTPPVASKDQDVLFAASRSPSARITGITRERTLHLDDDGIESISVPRPGAASDSSATWRPHGASIPDRTTFTGFLDISSEPMLYDVRLAWPLPPHSAMALYWTDLDLSAEESVEFSYRYEPASAGRKEQSRTKP